MQQCAVRAGNAAMRGRRGRLRIFFAQRAFSPPQLSAIGLGRTPQATKYCASMRVLPHQKRL
eukprot:scaffold13629_cov101-Isochrysis_galbana.AAC.1